MLTITYTLRTPRTLQPEAQQLAAINALVLLRPEEAEFMRLQEVSKTPTVVGNEVQVVVVYNTLGAVGLLPSFETLYPTPAAQKAAVTHLLIGRFKVLNNLARQTGLTIV